MTRQYEKVFRFSTQRCKILASWEVLTHRTNRCMWGGEEVGTPWGCLYQDSLRPCLTGYVAYPFKTFQRLPGKPAALLFHMRAGAQASRVRFPTVLLGLGQVQGRILYQAMIQLMLPRLSSDSTLHGHVLGLVSSSLDRLPRGAGADPMKTPCNYSSLHIHHHTTCLL